MAQSHENTWEKEKNKQTILFAEAIKRERQE